MTEYRTIAYTGDDLIEIGKVIKRITKRLKAFQAYSESDIENNIQDMRVDVLFEDEVVGHVGFEDGWLGFFPRDITTSEEENK
jgi:hypothetical protein